MKLSTSQCLKQTANLNCLTELQSNTLGLILITYKMISKTDYYCGSLLATMPSLRLCKSPRSLQISGSILELIFNHPSILLAISEKSTPIVCYPNRRNLSDFIRQPAVSQRKLRGLCQLMTKSRSSLYRERYGLVGDQKFSYLKSQTQTR